MDDPAARFRFGTAQLASGPRLHYAECGDGNLPSLLLLHGWPDSWFSYSRVMAHLPPRYHVLAIDQRGFGDSERPGSGYAIDDLAADAVAFLDTMGIGSAAVVGHSMGTFVARQVAEAHPERVEQLALIGTGWSGDNPVMREVQAALRDLPDPVSLEFARQFQASTVHAPVAPEFFERIVNESLKLPGRLWRALFDSIVAFDDTERLAGISARTLLIWGEHDALFPREDQLRLTGVIRGARLTVYPDTGHCPNWERPAQVAADLDAFFQER